jgi:hypothetical protein
MRFETPGAGRSHTANGGGNTQAARVRGKACCAALLLALPLWTPPGQGQTASSAGQTQAQPNASALLQPTLNELRSTIAELRIAKWKAPGPVKEEAQSNAASIDRDLQNTLPGLIAQADAAPQTVSNRFAVYRNLDALYDVLLRISGTAELAASDDEAANVSHSLMTLEAARRALADSILSASQAEETALEQARQQLVLLRRPAAPPTPAPVTVVSDGPAPATTAHKKPKPKPKAVQTTPQN